MRPTWRVWIFVPLNSTTEHEELFHEFNIHILRTILILRRTPFNLCVYSISFKDINSYIYFLIHDRLLSPAR